MYVLIATTRGDSLIAPKDSVIAAHENRTILEDELLKRKTERDIWLAKYGKDIPEWATAVVFSNERIEEI